MPKAKMKAAGLPVMRDVHFAKRVNTDLDLGDLIVVSCTVKMKINKRPL
jgi:hypothetical protein